MYTVSIFILFLFLTGFPIRNNVEALDDLEPLKESYITPIAEHFQILSRVINGIYLQSAALQKDIQIHHILSELLQITPQNLKTITAFDVTSAKSELNRMQKELSERLKDINFKMKFYKGITNDDMEIAKSYLMFYKTIATTMPMQYLENSSNLPSTELPAEAAQIKNSEMFKSSCTSLNYTVLDINVALFSPYHQMVPIPENEDLANVALNFGRDQNKLFSCMKELESLQSELENLKILKMVPNYELVKVVRTLSTRFVTLESFADTTKDTEKSVLQSMRGLFEMTKPIWNSENAENMRDVINDLYMSVKSIHEYNQDYEDFDFIHTAGFHNSSDLIRVHEDLKSEWFQKEIVRKANTSKLVKAFTPFRMVSEKMIDLETTWDQLADVAENELNGEDLEGLGFVSNFKYFAANYSAELNSLDDLRLKLDKCIKLKNPKYDTRKLEDFEKQERLANNILQKIKTLTTEVSVLNDYLKETIGVNINRGEHVKRVVTGVTKRILPKAIQMAPYSIKEVVEVVEALDVSQANTFYVIKKIGQVSRQLEDLKIASEQIDQKKLKDMKTLVKDLKLFEVAQCIKKTIPEHQFNHAHDVVNAFLSLRMFPKDDVIDQVNRYLDQLLNVQIKMESVQATVIELRKNVIKKGENSSVSLSHSKVITENIGMCTRVLQEMDKARDTFKDYNLDFEFSRAVHEKILDLGLSEWEDPTNRIDKMMIGIDFTNRIAKELQNGSVEAMAKVFEAAANVVGLTGSKANLHRLYEELQNHYNTKDTPEAKFFNMTQNLDLDFSKHHSRLKNARVTVSNVKKFFDDLFERNKPNTKTVLVEKYIEPAVSWIMILCLCIAFIFLLIIACLMIYGLTEKGRAHYRNLYIYYFGKDVDFEKRWRYSLFMDTVDEKNVLLDAVREGNRPNLLKALKNGAYIDAYNKFGNTALHLATKFALPDHVELIIQYGADRTLLNSKNLYPMQMVPYNYKEKYPERIEKYKQIKEIYKKYERKSYKISVPQAFPYSSFHIWLDDKVDDVLGDKFSDRFRAITSDEPIPGTTHVIFKTDKDGILETDSLEALSWIFHGAIIVKEQWMTDCLENESLIHRDMDYLIEKVKYKGHVYDTVLQWSEAMSKSQMPYLLGVFVAVVAKDFKGLIAMSQIVNGQGGTFLNMFPLKEHFNINSRPYLHAHLGPLFLIHDGTMDLSAYKNDPDKMYTCFTEDEFVTFMLKRETNRDTRPNPISVLKNEEA